MAAGDLYRVSYFGTVHGQTTINTFYYLLFSGGIGSTEPDIATDLATQFRTIVDPAIRSVTSQQWTQDRIVVTNVSIFPTIGFEDLAAAAPGSVIGLSAPASVAVVLSRRTSIGGRAGRGRIYLSGVPLSFIDESSLSGPAIANYEAIFPTLLGNLIIGGKEFRPRHAIRQVPPGDTRTFTGAAIVRWLVNVPLRNQRRRQVGVGI